MHTEATNFTDLSSAVLSDALDSLGLLHQVMDPGIRPVAPDALVFGRARTGRYVESRGNCAIQAIYEPVVHMVDGLRPGDVMVLACGPSGRIQPWGELLSLAASLRGASGCICDGFVRDVRRIRALGFPTFSVGYGAMQMSARGRLIDTDVPVQCGGVWVSPGDLVFGDLDGVVVVPQEAEGEVLRRARDRIAHERDGVRAVSEGVRLPDIMRRHGSL